MTSRWITAAAFGMGALMFGALAIGMNRGNIALAQTTNCTTGSAGLTSAEAEMIHLINGARAQQGLGILLVSPALNQAAAWMAEDFKASAPSHNDSLGRGPHQCAMDCGYPTGAGENIAWGYGSASGAFNGWMNSSGHRSNILGASYKVIGIGYANGTWVANFGAVIDSGAYELVGAPPPPPPPPPTSTPTPWPTPIPTSPPITGGGNAAVPAQPTSAPTSTPAAQPTYWNPDALQYPNGPVTPRVRVPMLSRQ